MLHTIVRRLSLGLALALLAGCSGAPAAKKANTTRAAAPPTATDARTAPILPVTAPEILARARAGSVTLVNVWATWCGPCREEFPDLVRVARRRSNDVRLMLVSADFDDHTDQVRAFLAPFGIADTIYLKTGNDMAFINGIHPDWTGAIPATLVFDRTGRLVSFWEGRAEAARFERAIDKALAAGGTPEGTP